MRLILLKIVFLCLCFWGCKKSDAEPELLFDKTYTGGLIVDGITYNDVTINITRLTRNEYRVTTNSQLVQPFTIVYKDKFQRADESDSYGFDIPLQQSGTRQLKGSNVFAFGGNNNVLFAASFNGRIHAFMFQFGYEGSVDNDVFYWGQPK